MSGTKLEKHEAGAAYGSLYMNQGEKLQKAKVQIIRVSEQKPLVWFFDIVCTPNQMPNAQSEAAFITGYIKGINGDIAEDNIVVGVTTDGMDRPAWNMMQQLIKGRTGPTDNVLEVKTGKRYTYIGGRLRK